MKGLGKVKNLGSKMKTYTQAIKALGINTKDQATESGNKNNSSQSEKQKTIESIESNTVKELTNTVLMLQAQIEALVNLVNQMVESQFHDDSIQKKHISEKLHQIALIEVIRPNDEESSLNEKEMNNKKKRNINEKEVTVKKLSNINQFKASGSLVYYKEKREAQRLYKRTRVNELE